MGHVTGNAATTPRAFVAHARKQLNHTLRSSHDLRVWSCKASALFDERESGVSDCSAQCRGSDRGLRGTDKWRTGTRQS